MALQICPRCKRKAITWAVYDDDPYTHWDCQECGYQLLEDESKEKECPDCKSKQYMYVFDNEKKFWWCCGCGKIEIHK